MTEMSKTVRNLGNTNCISYNNDYSNNDIDKSKIDYCYDMCRYTLQWLNLF